MARLVFKEATHQYFVGDKELTSVTTFLGKFFAKFDPKGPSFGTSRKINKEADACMFFSKARMPTLVRLFMDDEQLAKEYWTENRNNKWFMTTNKVKEMWTLKGKLAAAHGTEVHDTLENIILDTNHRPVYEFEKSPRKVAQGCKYIRDEIQGEMIPEMRLHSIDMGLAGTIDLVEKVTGGVILHDWKTNQAIDIESKYGKRGISPISHLADCNFVKYSLQLNIYAAMYESEFDEKVLGMYISHLTEDTYNKIECLDLRDELGLMLAV